MPELSDKTYDSLKTLIGEWLAKSNLTDRIPDFIYLAELKLFRSLNLLEFEQTQSGSLTSGSATLERPSGSSRLLALYYYEGTTTHTLKPKAPNIFFETANVRESGQPVVMTVIGSDIHLGPIPDSDYSYVLHYVGQPSHLASGTQTNSLLTLAPDIYLYASLMEAEPYLKNDERLILWRSMLDESISALAGEDHEARYSGGELIPSAG